MVKGQANTPWLVYGEYNGQWDGRDDGAMPRVGRSKVGGRRDWTSGTLWCEWWAGPSKPRSPQDKLWSRRCGTNNGQGVAGQPAGA